MDDPEAFAGWARSQHGRWQKMCTHQDADACWDELLSYSLIAGEPVAERQVCAKDAFPGKKRRRY